MLQSRETETHHIASETEEETREVTVVTVYIVHVQTENCTDAFVQRLSYGT